MESTTEGVELREISLALRRGARWLLLGGLLGLVAGALVLWRVAPRYEARTLVLIRSEDQGAQGTLAKLSGMLGGLGPAVGGSTLETETAILQSRAVVGSVVDSLGLQATVIHPRATAPGQVFSRVALASEIDGAEYRFEREGGSYRVEGGGTPVHAVPGVPFRLPEGELALRPGRLPDAFTVALTDRQSAIDAVQSSIELTADQGDAVEMTFRSGDPATAARVLNSMVSVYLERRRTADRGTGQHRYEFLAAHVDTIQSQLSRAEAGLRAEQERSGVFDPALSGQTELERAMAVQAELDAADVEARALTEIVQRGGDSTPARELAAYPTLLRNPAVTDVLSRLSDLETRRLQLRENRSESDPEVQTLGRMIAHLDARLLQLSTSYLQGLNQQRQGLRRELAGYRATLGTLPRDAEQSYRTQREVKRLSETLVAMKSQLVQARLDAISEGGDVHQVDPAVPPRHPVFPNRPLTLFGGLLGGLFFGLVGAVAAGRKRSRVGEPWEAEAATGLPVAVLDPALPLFYGELAMGGTVLVVPVGADASGMPAAEQLARTAGLQGRNAVLADLRGGARDAVRTPAEVPVPMRVEGGDGRGVQLTVQRNGHAVYPAGPAPVSASPRSVLETLEERFTTVVAVLPPLSAPETTSVLTPGRSVVLVARVGAVSREELRSTSALCRQMDAALLGLVLLPRGGFDGNH